MNQPSKVLGVFCLLLTLLPLAASSEEAPWEQQTWHSTIYYRGDFTASEALEGYLYIAAVKRYEVYLNGNMVGADSVWTRMQAIPVSIADGNNQLAVKVTNHGTGAGNGVMIGVMADEQVVGRTTTDNSIARWVWTDVPQEGTGWTTAGVVGDAEWGSVQTGSIDEDAVEGMLDPAPEMIAGFPGGADLGSVAGGIVLRRLAGQNLALDRPTNRIQVVDGNMNTNWSPPVNALNFNAWIDLQERRNISSVRVITHGANEDQWEANSLRGYSIQISDDQIRWSEVGAQHDITDYRSTEVHFQPIWTRYVRLVINQITAITQPRLAQIEIYGGGYAEQGTYVSDPTDFGTDGLKNFGHIVWDAEVPNRTDVTLQFRTGDDPDDFSNPNSGWSEPTRERELDYPAREPGRFMQYRVNMTTVDDTRTPVFRGLQVHFDTDDIAASRAEGRVTPNQLGMAVDTTFTYHLDLQFSPDDLGVERLRIDTPSEVVLEEIQGLASGIVRDWYSTQRQLSIYFTEPLRQDKQLIIRFRGTTYAALHQFRSYLYSPGSDAPLNVAQRIEEDPETGRLSSWALVATSVVDKVLSGVRPNPPVFSPNGDGLNDYTVVEFILSRITTPRKVDLQIYDLSGRLVRDLNAGRLTAGAYSQTPGQHDVPGLWDGRDDHGRLVVPGTYLYRIAVELDTGKEAQTGLIAVIY